MKTKLSVGGSGFAKCVAQSHVVPRLLVIAAMLALGTVAAWARGPVYSQPTNVIAMAQGTTTNIYFTITDDAVGWSGISSTTVKLATNGVLAGTILTVTNVAAPYGPTVP